MPTGFGHSEMPLRYSSTFSLNDSGAAMVGDPARCVEIGERYAASGCDMLFCLVNPYKIPHKAVMRSIELLGEHVIPALA